ncbi:class I SAM-dependent methyltransferase [Kitasatospora sp. NPDC085879]|uniref:SAM-dependent methyltransferase n=1 Tax=Kitasatospora sp. NPDC085879 TaxID=3154769 RepID=UPI003427F093
MNRERISDIAHTEHPIRSPLDDASVRRLLERGLPRGDERVLDLGCGGGEWLLRALTAHPKVHAEGVDVSADALALADRAAEELGVRDRLVLHRLAAEEFTSPQPFDLVLCVGSTHAFGGLLPTLAAARRHLAPGGRVLVGDGFWERTPSPEAVEMLGDFADLAGTVENVSAAGWVPVDGHISTRSELDAYEWSCWGSLASWALEHPEDPDSGSALDMAGIRRSEWLQTYRDTWGFLSLVLRRAPGAA